MKMMARANHRTLASLAAILLLLMATALGAGAAQQAAAAGAGGGGDGSYGAATVRCTGWHAVRPGETCESVARDARLTVDQLSQLNKNVGCAALIRWKFVCIRGAVIGG